MTFKLNETSDKTQQTAEKRKITFKTSFPTFSKMDIPQLYSNGLLDKYCLHINNYTGVNFELIAVLTYRTDITDSLRTCFTYS